MVTALLGLAIFGEKLPPLWWVGAAGLVVGNVVIGRREEGEEKGKEKGNGKRKEGRGEGEGRYRDADGDGEGEGVEMDGKVVEGVELPEEEDKGEGVIDGLRGRAGGLR